MRRNHAVVQHYSLTSVNGRWFVTRGRMMLAGPLLKSLPYPGVYCMQFVCFFPCPLLSKPPLSICLLSSLIKPYVNRATHTYRTSLTATT